ncbi:MAG: prohibitin family protein [Myxococcales bacterium]|nr:prohibitin family protein [Myxococcales bacterium]
MHHQPPRKEADPIEPKQVRLRNGVDRTSMVTLAALVVLGVVIYLLPNILVAVHSGEAGVLWRRFGGGTDLDITYGEGTVVTWPWNKVHVYDLTVKQIRTEATVYTSDGMLLEVKVSGRCRPDRERLPQLHRDVGPDYIYKVVEPELITSVRTVIGKYDSKQVYAHGEAGLLEEIRSEFRRRLENQDIIYDDVLLVKMLIPNVVQDAIQRKLAIEQDALSYQFRIMREKQEKIRRALEAEGIQAFERISGVSMTQWRALEATTQLATSDNAKIVVLGNDAQSLPVLLNAELNKGIEAGDDADRAPPRPTEDAPKPPAKQ